MEWEYVPDKKPTIVRPRDGGNHYVEYRDYDIHIHITENTIKDGLAVFIFDNGELIRRVKTMD